MKLISNSMTGKSDFGQRTDSFLGTFQLENAQDFCETLRGMQLMGAGICHGSEFSRWAPQGQLLLTVDTKVSNEDIWLDVHFQKT